MALKAYKRDKEKLREQYYAQLAGQNRQRMFEREQREAADLERRNAQTQKDQLQQLAEYKARHLAQQAADQAEGDAIRARVLELQREEAEKEEARKRLGQQRNRENKEANVELAKLKDELARRDKEEEAKIAAYAQEKERILQARKEAQEAAFKCVALFLFSRLVVFTQAVPFLHYLRRAKMDTRQRLIDAQIERLRAFQSNEEQRLASQQAEAEAAEQQKEAAKQAAREALAKEIEHSRAQQLERKEAEKQREEQEAAQREQIRLKEFAEFVAKEQQVDYQQIKCFRLNDQSSIM